MKVDILDYDVFNAISPNQVEKYLVTRSWIKRRLLPNDVSIWDLPSNNGQKYRIWLPEATDLADFPKAMGKVVRVLSEAENRSQIQLIDDFETVGIGDVIRLNEHDKLNRYSSTLPYDEGSLLIQRGKDMLMTGALSAHEAKAYYSSGRANPVREFESSLRLGQTEHGSYTIKLIAPITENKLADLENEGELKKQELLDIPTQPFSRRAVMKMVSGLNLLHEIGHESERSGKYYFDPFVNNIISGVNANLCEAVSNWKHIGQFSPLNVSVSWSYLLESSSQMSNVEIEFPSNYMRFYKQASEDFRRRVEEKNTLYGFVKILQREQGEDAGIISLAALVDGRQRMIRMELNESDYQTALRSHKEDIFARVTGILDRGKRTYWLRSPENFVVVENLELL